MDEGELKNLNNLESVLIERAFFYLFGNKFNVL